MVERGCLGDIRRASRNQLGGAGMSEEAVTFLVTGFGSFQGVSRNPSGEAVQELGAALALERTGPNAYRFRDVNVSRCDVLEVSADSVIKYLQGCALDTDKEGAKLSSESSGRERGPVVLLHVGVNVNAQDFCLERRAANDASFSCPDEQGWQPNKSPVDREDPSVGARETALPLDELCEALRFRGFQNVQISSDAGRFVCNYVYYLSLKLTQSYVQTDSLFLHVPPSDVIPVHDQVRFILELLAAIASCINSRTLPLRSAPIPAGSGHGPDGEGAQ